jgi:hypothetical protein
MHPRLPLQNHLLKPKNSYLTFFSSIASVASFSTGKSLWLMYRVMVLHLCHYYRDKLRGNLLLKQHQLEVDLRHVGLYNDELAHAIQDRPADVLPLVGVIAFVYGFLF